MPDSIRRSARFTLAMAVEQARALFTAEGERSWAHGWDPRYPDPARREGSGATFVTAHGARQTVWVMTDSEPDRVRYVRVTPNVDAGVVEVRCEAEAPEATTVTVTYDVTALGPEGASRLEAFAAEYEGFVASWKEEIERAGAAAVAPGLALATVRVARAVADLERTRRFYGHGLGLREIGAFSGHAGYSGVFFGLPGEDHHLEFTHHPGERPAPPGRDDLLVLYLEDAGAVRRAAARLAELGHDEVEPANPYWSSAVRSRTIADPDGWRVVLVEPRR